MVAYIFLFLQVVPLNTMYFGVERKAAKPVVRQMKATAPTEIMIHGDIKMQSAAMQVHSGVWNQEGL